MAVYVNLGGKLLSYAASIDREVSGQLRTGAFMPTVRNCGTGFKLPACRRFLSRPAVEEVIVPEAIGITCSEIELRPATIVTVGIGDVERACG